MTTIGYATLQIIPSLKGVSDSINKQLGFLPGQGLTAGKQLGSGIATGVRGSESQISAALSQAVNSRGGEKAGQQWADSTASAMAKHLQSAQNSQKLQSSLTYLVKNGDAAGKKFAADMASQLAIELPVQTRAQQVGEKVGTVIGRSIGFGIKAAAGAAVAGIAGIGYTLTKGFERLASIDQATFKLKALGHSGDEVKTIMDNALASVKGTSFGLADAATAAASAVAAGVKPGQDLTKYLTEISDAAAVAGTSFSDMGAIFNSIQTLNKAFTGDLRQLSDRGLPIFEWLQKEYGVTAEKLNEMVQKGEVDSAHFKDAIDKNIGGAAKNMGQSFDGAVQNLEASVARLGANFITALLGGDQGGSALAGPTQAIGNLTTKFDDIGVWVKAHSAEIHGFFIDIKNVAIEVGGAVKDIGTWLVENKGAAEILAGVFVGWKVATTILGVVESLQKMSVLLRTTLVADAEATAGAIGTGTGIGATGLIGGVFALAGALGVDLGFTIFDKMQKGARDAQAAMDEANRKLHEEFPGKPVTPTGVPAQTGSTAPNDPLNPNNIYGHATGGSIRGPGTGTSDSIPAWLSNGEHVLTAKDVQALGGQGGVYTFRNMLHRAGGGPIQWMDIIKLGSSGGGGDLKGPGVGDIGKRIDSPLKPANPIWGDRRIGTILGPNYRPRGPGKKVDLIFPWWMFPGDQQDPGTPGRANWKNHIGLLGFAGGGAIGPDVSAAGALVGTAYSQANRTDCSGMVARVIDRTLGLPEAGLMSTKNAADWLAALGFKKGIGGPGMISVGWYDHGPNPNDGHMAMTLSDGRNAEAGGSVGVFTVGAGAAGASSPEFDQHMFLPTVYGEGPAGSSAASPFTGGSAAAVTGAASAAPTSSSGGGTSSSSGGGGSSFSLPSSIGGLAAFGLDDLGKGIGTTKSGSDLSLFGKAAGAAVSGQVDSALGVLGVNGSPGWLKAISTLVGGISIGGGSSAAPLSATSTGMGTPPPDDPGNMHGSRAGQAPGPSVVINARDTEDAFIKYQRLLAERSAAKLSRF